MKTDSLVGCLVSADVPTLENKNFCNQVFSSSQGRHVSCAFRRTRRRDGTHSHMEEALGSRWSRSESRRAGVSAPVIASMTLYSFLSDSTNCPRMVTNSGDGKGGVTA